MRSSRDSRQAFCSWALSSHWGSTTLVNEWNSANRHNSSPTLAAWRPNLANVGLFAALLAVVLLVWARASIVVFALFFAGGLPSFADVVRTVLTFEQADFALVYFAVGGFFATFVFAISVIALPLMLDRETDAITAAIASLVACGRNPGPMLLWAACIVLLVTIGFATFFFGLILTMPLVGHATWHAYRDLVQVDDHLHDLATR